MNPNFKPFRLINNRELEALRQGFVQTLQDWNEQHALFPLSCSLYAEQSIDHQEQELLLFSDQEKPIALLAHDPLFTMKHCLFGDLSSCFDAISLKQLTELLSRLLKTQVKDMDSKQFIKTDWFYKGSPSVALTIGTASHKMRIHLHPVWVLNILPQAAKRLKPKANLQEALALQKIHCQIELSPCLLQLKDMMNLCIGDVIRTDHKLSDPILLKHQKHIVAPAHLGESKPFKSIKIASSK